MSAVSSSSVRRVLIHEMSGSEPCLKSDYVSVEEPLEIRLVYHTNGARSEKTICVTMRTPGNDAELVLGYLFAEGVIGGIGDVASFPTHGSSSVDGSDRNVFMIELNAYVPVDMRRLERNVFTTSSCGICSAPSLDAVAHAMCPDLPRQGPMSDSDVIYHLPDALHDVQTTFRQTGGLHAAALFDANGRLLRVREDVGRHNAMDKLIGSCVRDGLCPLSECIVLVSGRASYELVQKTLVAGVPVLAAVGAPSSLAIDLAQAHNLTLLGFVREGRYNVYHGEDRLRTASTAAATVGS